METKVLSIDQICSRFSSGKNITATNIKEAGEYPVYGGNGLRGYTDKYNFEGECSVVGRQGAYCGNVKYVVGKSYMSEHAVVAVTRPEHNNKYFSYKLALANLGRFSGQAAQPGLSVTKMLRLKFEMPSKEYQDKIASILSTYDTLIENNTKRIRLLEQMAENLYKEWFVRFRFPGHENVEMENGLPKGWKSCKVKEIYDTSSGGTPSRSKLEYFEGGNILWIKTGELQDCLIYDTEEKITDDAVKHSSAKMIPSDSLVMAMYGVNIGKLGITTVVTTCNQACCVFKEKKYKSSKFYLFHYFKSIREYLLSISFGAAQQNLSQELIKNIKIIVPDEATLKAFEKKEQLFFNEILSLELQNQNLTRQRDLLLPRLMSGKLEVTV